MLNDFQPPLSSKFLILHLLVYLFNVSWINQEENLAEKQEFYLYHFITFASSPTPVFTFSAKNLGIAFFFNWRIIALHGCWFLLYTNVSQL